MQTANVEVSTVAVMPVGTGYTEVKREAYGKNFIYRCKLCCVFHRKKKQLQIVESSELVSSSSMSFSEMFHAFVFFASSSPS